MGRGCITTLNRQAWSDENLENEHRGTPRPVFLLEKILRRFFWNWRGILLVDFLYKRRTINAVSYGQLHNGVKLPYRQERRDLRIWSTAWQHPIYSPDLSPFDYHVFGSIKDVLSGHHFDNEKRVEAFVRTWLQTRPNSVFDEGIKTFRFRCKWIQMFWIFSLFS